MALTGKPTLTTNAQVQNDGFWPDLMIDELLSQYRIPSEYADDVVRQGLLLSMLHVNESLLPVEAALKAMDYCNLMQYARDMEHPVNDVYPSETRYKHAVFSRAKAFLLQQFNTLNHRSQAENIGKESVDTEQYWLDQSQAEIRFFFGRVLPEQHTPAQFGFHASLI